MRVVYLTTGCFDKGGISRYSRYQIRALRELYGAQNVRCLSLLGPDGTGFEEPIETQWHGRRGGRFDKVRFTGHLFAHVLSSRPAVIHAAHVHLAGITMLAARAGNATSIANVYGLELWSGLSRLRQCALGKMDCVISDCHFSADYVEAHKLYSRRPAVIWDCVDHAKFSPGRCPERVLKKYGVFSKDDYFVILTLGRLSIGAVHKGYDRLIRVFARLAQRNDHVRLVIAGQGDYRQSLEELTRHLGLKDKVRFTGGIDECDLADVYRAATVFSLVSDRGPSRGEGLPLTPLEAMACGIPIVVGNQDGSPEAVFDGQNGYVIDPFDLDRHEACFRELMDDSARLAAMSTASIRVSKEYFGFERFVRQTRELYEMLRSPAGVSSRPPSSICDRAVP